MMATYKHRKKLEVMVELVNEKNKKGKIEKQCNILGVPKTPLLRSLLSYGAFVTGGIFASIIGAALLDLQEQTGASTEEAAMLFTWQAVGKLLGVMVVGLLFDKVNQMLLLAVTLVIGAVSSAVIPWCSTYGWLAVPMVTFGLELGAAGGILNPLMMYLWGSKAGPFIQFLHFSFAAGATVAPLIVQPHLKQATMTANVTDNNTSKTQYYIEQLLSTGAVVSGNQSFLKLNSSLNFDHTKANSVNRSAFIQQSMFSVEDIKIHDTNISNMDIGVTVQPYKSKNIALFWIFTILAAAKCINLFLVLLHELSGDISFRPLKKAEVSSSKSKRNPSLYFSVFAVGLLLVLFYVAGGVEITYGGLVLSYVVHNLNWTKASAALLTSAFWGSLAIGRGLGAFVTNYNRSHIILCTNLSVISVTTIVIAVFGHYHESVLWTGTIMIGLGLSTSISNGFLFVQRFKTITGRISSLIIICLYIGQISIPALCGVLFDNFGEYTFPYVILGTTILALVSVLFVMLLDKIIHNNRSFQEETIIVEVSSEKGHPDKE